MLNSTEMLASLGDFTFVAFCFAVDMFKLSSGKYKLSQYYSILL